MGNVAYGQAKTLCLSMFTIHTGLAEDIPSGSFHQFKTLGFKCHCLNFKISRALPHQRACQVFIPDGKTARHSLAPSSGHILTRYSYLIIEPYLSTYMVVSMAMGVYPHSWMVYVMENPNPKWMMTGGTPVYGNPHIICWILTNSPTWKV